MTSVSPEFRPDDSISTIEQQRYVHQVIKQTIELRDLESIKQQRDILRQAMISLIRIFQMRRFHLIELQRMNYKVQTNYRRYLVRKSGQTLIDYLTLTNWTKQRMLRQTDKLLFEIASKSV